MIVNIRTYQEAYETTLNKLKSNNRVLAIVVYGSMVSGDIWEESDIDLLVITNEKGKSESIYSKVFDIYIHLNYISKEDFINSYKNLLKGGAFHKAFFTGKLVYCSDDDIKNIHMSTRFYGDKDRNTRNIEILCSLLNSIHYSKKYLITGKYETSYQWCIDVLNNYARLLMSLDGHITDKDILSFAVSVHGSIESLFNVIDSDEKLPNRIEQVLDCVEEFLNYNIERISNPLIDYLKNAREAKSVEDLRNSSEFRQIEGDLSILLVKLSGMGFLREGLREHLTDNNEYLIDEIVYLTE